MLQRILPEGLFGKVERLRAGEALNEGRGPIRPSAAAATTDAVMEANAAMLGQMSIERNLLMQFMHRLEEMMTRPE